MDTKNWFKFHIYFMISTYFLHIKTKIFLLQKKNFHKIYKILSQNNNKNQHLYKNTILKCSFCTNKRLCIHGRGSMQALLRKITSRERHGVLTHYSCRPSFLHNLKTYRIFLILSPWGLQFLLYISQLFCSVSRFKSDTRKLVVRLTCEKHPFFSFRVHVFNRFSYKRVMLNTKLYKLCNFSTLTFCGFCHCRILNYLCCINYVCNWSRDIYNLHNS